VDWLIDDSGIDLCRCLGLCLLAGLPSGHDLVLHLCTAPVAMLAPPQARRLRPGEAATKKEAVKTHSNARFGGEKSSGMSAGTTFFALCKAGPWWRSFASYTRNTELPYQPVR